MSILFIFATNGNLMASGVPVRKHIKVTVFIAVYPL